MVKLLAKLWHFLTSITLSGIESVVKKELIQLFRDPFLVTFIIALPIAQLLVTGLAISKDLKHINVVVCNYDNRNASIELVKEFQNSVFFNVEPDDYVSSETVLAQLIRKGAYRVGLVIPPDYSKNLLKNNQSAQVRLVIDGANANVAKSIRAMAETVMQHHIHEVVKASPAAAERMAASVPPIEPITQVLYNPDLKTAYFLIPGILALIMHMMTILFTSFAIVRERESGTLEQLMATPIRVSDLMIGKVIPYAVIGLADMLLTLAVMVWFFDINISGSFWLLLVNSVVFIVTSLTIGLLISTTCRSQVQAVQLTMGLLLPSMMISGFVFPLEPMPWVIKVFSYLLPITHYLEIIRGVVIKGSGLAELWTYTAILAVLAMVLLIASMVRFKKQVA